MIHLPAGRTFTIEARNLSPENMYIQSATLDGAPYGRAYLRHGDIVKGGTLVFEMGPRPNTAWASAREDAPVLDDGTLD